MFGQQAYKRQIERDYLTAVVDVTMIQAAIASAFRGCVELPDEDTDYHSSYLQQLAKDGNVDGLRKALKSPDVFGAINTRNHLGCTALRIAASEGHVECVKYLLEVGSKVDIPDVKLQTPLMAAMKNTHFNCAEILLQNNACPEGHKNHLMTPLYVMTMQGCYNGMKLLLDYGANPNGSKADFLLSSIHIPVHPLHIAITYKHYRCIRLLLQYGADPNLMATDPDGLPCCMAAAKDCGPVVFEMLNAAGADIVNRYKHLQNLTSRSDVKQYLQHLSETPRSLKFACRLAMNRNCDRNLVSNVNSLDIPAELKHYLVYDDIVIHD